MPTSTDQGLLAEYDEMRGELRRFLIARTGREDEAEDVLGDLWIKLRAIHTGPVGKPRSYLYAMANNLVFDRRREASRRKAREQCWSTECHGFPLANGEMADDSIGTDEAINQRQEVERLRDAIAQLPPGAQRVLRMHKIDERSHGEIADALGISRSAVEKHMAVAMAHLRRLLED